MTAIETNEEKADRLIRETAAIVAPLVKDIEAGPQLTQFHYGRYLVLIGQGKDRLERQLFALACLEAGANKAGVHAALRILGV